MSWFDYCEYSDEYEDSYEDAWAGFHTKKRYNQGKHIGSYESYDPHHITCKKCGAVGLSWGQVNRQWKLFSPCEEIHKCITGKAEKVEIDLPQKIAELKKKQKEKLTRPVGVSDCSEDKRDCCDMYCNKRGDITVNDMGGLIEFANSKYFNHDDRPTDLVTWLMLRAFDARFDKNQAMAYHLAAMIISRVDPELY